MLKSWRDDCTHFRCNVGLKSTEEPMRTRYLSQFVITAAVLLTLAPFARAESVNWTALPASVHSEARRSPTPVKIQYSILRLLRGPRANPKAYAGKVVLAVSGVRASGERRVTWIASVNARGESRRRGYGRSTRRRSVSWAGPTKASRR